MSKKFAKALQIDTNLTLTENMAVAKASTNSELLNFFSVGGALRARTEDEIISLFDKAFTENPEYALKALFYFRDIRGGQGERRTFRVILKYLAELSSKTENWLSKNLHLIPEYGRWDDLLVLEGTFLEDDAFTLMAMQLAIDARSDKPSLAAKWLPSENASSVDSKRQAYKIMKITGLKPRQYRKMLSKVRAKLDVIERKISAGEWDEVNYEHVPSQANILYRKAFLRHDTDRYREFIEAVASGEKKIKAGVLFPYEIVRKCIFSSDGETRQTLDALWKNLPDYFEGKPEDSLVVCDTSGSMHSNQALPLCVAVSLAIYTAERNKGVFHNQFITFSDKPTFQKVTGSDIQAKVTNLSRAHWDANTNIEAVFGLILNTAIRHKLSNDDMVKKLYIVSDMEFDAAAGSYYSGSYGWRRGMDYTVPATLFQTIRKKYEDAGYTMPLLVFWNVESRNTQFPMSLDERGFVNVSGCSPSIYKSLLKSEFKDAYAFMLEVLNSKRYEAVQFAA